MGAFDPNHDRAHGVTNSAPTKMIQGEEHVAYRLLEVVVVIAVVVDPLLPLDDNLWPRAA